MRLEIKKNILDKEEIKHRLYFTTLLILATTIGAIPLTAVLQIKEWGVVRGAVFLVPLIFSIFLYYSALKEKKRADQKLEEIKRLAV